MRTDTQSTVEYWIDQAKNNLNAADDFKAELKVARKEMRKLERERDEALAYADELAAGLPEGMLPKDVEVLRDANLALAVERDALQEQLDAAIMLGKLQERRHDRELEQVREQYRLSSVCCKLKAENEQLKQQQQQ